MKRITLLLSILFYSAFVFAQDCASITVTGGNGQVTVSGLSGAPIAGIQVFNSSWTSVYNQTYTSPANSIVVSPLSAGTYFVNVRLYNANWGSICEKGANATVTTTPVGPSDTCGATFQKRFGTANTNEEGIGISKSSDGGYFVVGQSATSGNTGYNGLVMKFNNNGTLLWSKTLGGAQDDYLTTVVGTADGGCFVSGEINTNGLNTYSGDGWIFKLDASGNVVWQKRYFVSGTPGYVDRLIATTDGGFAFAGTFPFAPGAADWMIIKADANGNIQWQRKLGAGSSDGAHALVEDNHGGAGIVVGGVYYGTSYYDAVISKLDLATGNLLWTKTYDFDHRSNWIAVMRTVADGIVYEMSDADGWVGENGTVLLFKTDFNGNMVWAKEYAIPNCFEAQMTVLPDGGFALTQNEMDHGISDVYLMRLDANGNVMWTNRYPRSGGQWLWGLVSDGNYIVGAGSMNAGSYNDVLLAKFDLSGKSGACTATPINVTPRTPVITPLTFAWPTNAAMNLTTAVTTVTPVANNSVETLLCPGACQAVTISSVTVNENAGNAVLQVCVAAPAANNIVYNYTTADGSATSGSDYTGGSGFVTIAAGQTCGTITIPIINDANVESAETFTVSIGSVTGTVTINDDDQPSSNCSAVTFTPGNNLISVSGITAPVATVQVFNSSWASVFSQTYTNAPGTVNVPIGAGTYSVKVTFYTANWAYVCDKSENVTVVNNCPAGTICVSNICPSQTVNLNTAYSIQNLPAGTTVTWHTGTPATDANRMTDQQAQNVSVSGTYYAAINIAGNNCYSATIPVSVTIIACSSPALTTNAVAVNAENMPATRTKVAAFPIPFTSSLRVVIENDKKERAVISLMDVHGRQLKQMPVQLSLGTNTFVMDALEQLPSGNYFLRINADSGMRTLKVMRQQ